MVLELEPVHCPSCNRTDIVKHGKSTEGKQRYRYRNLDCSRSTFILQYSYQGYLPDVKQKISDMAVNGSGIAYGKAYAYEIPREFSRLAQRP